MKNKLVYASLSAFFICCFYNNANAQLSPFDVDTVTVTSTSVEDTVTTTSDSSLEEIEQQQSNGEQTYSPAITGTVQVGYSSLNVRTDVWGTIVGSLYTGNTVSIIGKKGDWYIINLNGQKRFIHSDYVSVPKGAAQANSSSSAAVASGNGNGSTTNPASSSGTAPAANNGNSSRTSGNGSYNTMYILGDSRSVGMSYVDSNKSHVYTAKVGEGYRYFSQNYQTVLNKATANDVIVINFGVNDLYNSAKYIALINSIADSTQASVYYMTVNPVDEAVEKRYGYQVTNAQINDFNNKLISGLRSSVNIIDSNNLLTSGGFTATDGLHYNNATYKEILSIIESNL